MQHNDYEMDQPRGDDDGYVVHQAPSSLLPTVLHRLGLDSFSASPPLQEDQAVVALGDHNWYVRAAAARTLGKLGEQAPLDSLLAALEDAHEMVRATAVHAAGLLGKRVPLEKIIAALQDPAWHVREVAALTLGELGERVPPEPLLAALNDTVAPVREVARAALQRTHPESASESFSSSGSNGVAQSYLIPLQTQIWQSESRKDIIPLSDVKAQYERTQRMKTLRSHSQAGKFFSRSLSIIAAVVLLSVIVGSLLFVLNIVRRNATTSQPAGPHLYVIVYNTIYKADPANGKVIWKYTFTDKNPYVQDPIQVPLTVVDGTVYFEDITPEGNGPSLYALDATTGVLRWHKELLNLSIDAPIVVNGVTYVCSDAQVPDAKGYYIQGEVYALNAKDGSERWHYKTPSLCNVGGVQHGMVYVSSYHTMEALTAAKGTVVWSKHVADFFDNGSQLVNGVLYAGIDTMDQNMTVTAKYLYAFNSTNGDELWHVKLAREFIGSGLTIADGRIYLDAYDNVEALSASTGQLLWNAKGLGTPAGEILVVNGIVYIPEAPDKPVLAIIGITLRITALNAADGTLRWSKVIKNYHYQVGPLALTNGLIYLGISQNYVVVLKAANGSQIKEYTVAHPHFKYNETLPVVVAP